MKPTLPSVILLVAVAAVALGAEPAPSTNTAPRRAAGPGAVRSPELLPDGRVTFRLRAPQASEVMLTGQWSRERAGLVRDAEGLWSVTVGPVPAGVWEYSFLLDGLTLIDPANPAIKPMREPRTSILHRPADPPALCDFQDVPHGAVHHHTYRSKSLDRARDLAVYTPPGYEEQSQARFPVLYLQHGMGDNQATWTVHGKAHWILDNLLAQGRAKPMLVVMMDGHASVPGAGFGGAGGLQNNTALFERDLLEDVLPLVEARYRVKPDAQSRALVGLSMGGGQSLTIGLTHPDRFAWVGGFSSAVPATEAVRGALAQPAALNGALKLLWIGCGREDFLLKRNEEFVAHLKEIQVRHEWHLTDGGHSWPVWRTYLADLAPRLFQ